MSRFDDVWRRAGDQRRHVRRIGGHAARGDGAGTAQRRSGAGSAVAPHAVSRQLRQPDLRRGPRVAFRTTAAEERRQARRPRSANWPTSGWTSCSRRGASISPRTTAASSRPRWCANWSVCRVELASDVLATVNAGSLAKPGDGVDTANARPGFLEYLTPIVVRRRAEGADGSDADRRRADQLPVAGRLGVVRRRGRHADARSVHRRHRDGAEDRRPRAVGAVQATRPAGRRPRRPRRNVPVAREEMIRFCAPAQWFARTVRKPFTIHDTTINPGQRIITLLASAGPRRTRVRRPRRVHLEPADRALARVRPRPALLPRRAPGPPRDRHHGHRVAQAGARTSTSITEAAWRPPSSFQWGWNSIPVEVPVEV